MGTFFFIVFIWLIVGFFLQLALWPDDRTKRNWRNAKFDYENHPSEANKKHLAFAATEYIKKRNTAHLFWLWPISFPLGILWLLVKAPKRLYTYIKSKESDYAQARLHMKGEVR